MDQALRLFKVSKKMYTVYMWHRRDFFFVGENEGSRLHRIRRHEAERNAAARDDPRSRARRSPARRLQRIVCDRRSMHGFGVESRRHARGSHRSTTPNLSLFS